MHQLNTLANVKSVELNSVIARLNTIILTGVKLTGLLFAILLQACAAVPTPTKINTQPPPNNLTNWTVRGKASFITNSNTDTVNIVWQRKDIDHDQIQLFGPVGFNALMLTRKASEIYWLKDGEEHPISTLPLETTVRRAIITLPVTKLGNWLLGYPSTTSPWKVSITQWQDTGPWRIPRKLILKHGTIEVRIVLLKWEIEAIP